MLKIKKYMLWLGLLLAHTIAHAQADSIRTSRTDSVTAPSPSPINPNSFNLDSIKQPITDRVLVVRHIYFVGNKKIRKKILLRELPFAEGDSIATSQLPETFEKAKVQLMNTSLFHNANVALYNVAEPYIDVEITVKERWYIYPLPYIRPVDRNINQWLFEKGANTSRLDYGVKLNYDNMTHNNDKLRFYLISGYTKQLIMSYNRPYIDKAMKWGVNLNLGVGKNHEINYASIDNKQAFLKDPNNYLRNFFNGLVEVSYRPKFYTKHYFGFSYNMLRVADTVLKLNPTFLKNGATMVKYPEVHYRMVYQNLDYIPYPTSGYAGEFYISKQGFNNKMNVWQFSVKGQGNWHLGPKTFYNISALGTLKLPLKQPFYTSQLLGYGDMTLRGYEYYVIDGVAGGMLNATLYKQLSNFSFSLPFLKWLTDRLIPLKIYGKVYGNAGYVYNAEPGTNRLSNRILLGGGLGFDVWTFNDFTFKLEFSFNQLGQNGLYLQKKTLY
ncbi:MAG: POTRA domain-containing protein [Niabella sp.]